MQRVRHDRAAERARGGVDGAGGVDTRRAVYVDPSLSHFGVLSVEALHVGFWVALLRRWRRKGSVCFLGKLG